MQKTAFKNIQYWLRTRALKLGENFETPCTYQSQTLLQNVPVAISAHTADVNHWALDSVLFHEQYEFSVDQIGPFQIHRKHFVPDFFRAPFYPILIEQNPSAVHHSRRKLIAVVVPDGFSQSIDSFTARDIYLHRQMSLVAWNGANSKWMVPASQRQSSTSQRRQRLSSSVSIAVGHHYLCPFSARHLAHRPSYAAATSCIMDKCNQRWSINKSKNSIVMKWTKDS